MLLSSTVYYYILLNLLKEESLGPEKAATYAGECHLIKRG